MGVLVEDLPPDARYGARLELAETLTRLYGQAGADVPQWLGLELEDRRRRS
jgi:hypothetical protein